MSPIKELVGNHTPGRGLPTLGKIYKGKPRDKKGRVTGDLDHFRVEFFPQYEFLKPAFESIYGENPKELNRIWLFGNTPDEAFPTWLETWRGDNQLVRRCDGENLHVWVDEQTAKVCSSDRDGNAPPCFCKENNLTGKNACFKVGRVTIFLLRLAEYTGVFGTFLLTTTSLHDIVSLHGYLSDIFSVFGRLERIEFKLGRAARKIHVPANINGEMKRIPKESHLLYLQVSSEMVKSRISDPRGLAPALPPPEFGESPQLPPPDDLEDTTVVEGEIEDDEESGVMTIVWPSETAIKVLYDQIVSDFIGAGNFDESNFTYATLAELVGIWDWGRMDLWEKNFTSGKAAYNSISDSMIMLLNNGHRPYSDDMFKTVRMCTLAAVQNAPHLHQRIKKLKKEGDITESSTVQDVIDLIILRAQEKDELEQVNKG